ncbi:uncharacterized protein LOC131887632 [Tigriopus californicus]|uniref:uncharacterized protein LOC131887632 n=1 Tax=Tigriopus californicus TaxID=6832 RepID=UPI0027DA6C15|nr:uncharacterized protein LOC131887632 [Tigriopus californicus]
MDNREGVLNLKSSRKGFKGVTKRAKRAALDAIQTHVDGTDPYLLELKLQTWESKLNRFQDAEEAVMCHPDADDNDIDKDLDAHEDNFDKARLKVRGIRQNFDQSILSSQPQASPIPPSQSPSTGLPNLNVKRPPILEEDTNLRSFLQWCPLWRNYSNLIALPKRDHTTQVSLLWECCSPGFLQIVHHSLDIRPDTGREVDDILGIIKDYLRSLRSVHLDMRDLLQVRQTDGQDYTSLCNVIRELAQFADLAHITEDRLLIALLLQAMKSESDRAHLMEKNFKTFDEARHCILEMETSRRGARGMTDSLTRLNAVKTKFKSNYKSLKNKNLEKAVACGFCGHSAHPKDKCPAQKAKCRICHQIGHWDKVCRNKNVKTDKYSSETRVGSVKLQVASKGGTNLRSNEIEVEVLPSHCHVKSKPVRVVFCADTGADISVMGESVLQETKLKDMVVLSEKFQDYIIGIDGKPVKQIGMFHANLEINGIFASNVPIVVCQDLQDAFLSLSACKALTIVDDNFPSPRSQIASLLVPKSDRSLHPMPEIWKNRELWISQLSVEASATDVFERIESKLRTIYSRAFETGALRPMKGPVVGDPMIIHLKDNAKPFAIHVARNIPFAYEDKTKLALESMVEQDIIGPVGDDPTEWCHPIVVVPKGDGDVRICVDLTRLNTEVKRSVHPIKTPAEAISGFNHGQKYFAKLDLVKGYWQMPLAEESQHLTTFLTPFGKFKFLRSPMGFVSTGDSFSYRGDVAMAGLDIQKVVDDMAVGAPDIPNLIRSVSDILERCVKFGLTVNAKKSVLAASMISFVGFIISPGTITPDPAKIEAIQKFPIPATLTDLRSFLGLANQLGKFLPNLACLTSPLRGLLKAKNQFQWLSDHTKVFEETRQALTSPPVLDKFDPSLDVILLTDASRLGLGYALLQMRNEVPRLIQCGSRYLKDCETRYAVIELEALCIYWAIKKCHLYLAGINFKVVTDHKPLIPIFNRQALVEIENPRVQNYRTRLLAYNFHVDWKQGISHAIPDALSRAPVSNPENDSSDPDDSEELFHFKLAVLKVEQPDLILDDLVAMAREDGPYGDLKKAVLSATIKEAKSGYVALFKKVASELSIEGDLVLRGRRIVIPPSAVKNILKKLHAGHQGVEKTKRRARQIIYWPGFTSDIANTVAACPECLYFRPSHQPEPLIQDDLPTRPFQVVTADIFTYDRNDYLVYSCRLSGFPTVKKYATSPSSSQIMKDFLGLFATFGVPNVLRTDNGPQFASSQFGQFLTKWGVQWKPSSPYYPQSNGHAEVMVKSMKYMLAKTGGNIHSGEFAEALLEFRNSPQNDGLSPAQRVFGRPIRSRIPTLEDILQSATKGEDLDRAEAKRMKLDRSRKISYDQPSHHLMPLANGSLVSVQNPQSRRWDRSAKILKSYGRRYLVEFETGNKS